MLGIADTISNDGSHWQIVKGIREMFPDIGISILSKAFVIKTIDLSDLTTLVISPENGNTISVSHFQCYKEGNSF